MKIVLHEDIEENTRILRELTAVISKWILDNLKRSEAMEYLDNIPGYAAIEKRFAGVQVFENNRKYIRDITVHAFYNPAISAQDRWYARLKKATGQNDYTMGYYHSDENRLSIFIHEITDYAGTDQITVRVKKVLNDTISHELRHFFQYREYPEHYYSKKVRSTVYTRRDTEVDAVFYQVLANTNPFVHIGRPQEYVKTVMDLLQQERDLTPKKQAQYRKQAGRYFAKHVDQQLTDVWKTAVKRNKKYLDLQYSSETFVSNVMDELEKYVATAHFREMHDPVYMEYRRLTRQYYAEKTRGQREQANIDKMSTRVYPIMIATAKQLIPQLHNSRIGVAEVIGIILKNTRQTAEMRGIKTNTPVYASVEKRLREKLESSLGP